MILTLPSGKRQYLTYELNVHRGETLPELRQSIRDFVIPLRSKLAPKQPFALAPRIGRGVLADLADPRARESLRAELREHDLRPITVNAFPLEDFHAQRVKESVYFPPWTEPRRADLTNAVADWLSEELPEGATGTISTLGGSYRAWGHTPTDFRRMARNYLDTVRHLARLGRASGREIVLAVEPEPDTTFETADDVVTLFEEHLLPQRNGSLTEDELRRHFAVNVDVCHLSVLFRDPLKEWRTLERAGLRVGKLHLTNALALRRPQRSPRGFEALRAFDEPRYLHQFAARRSDGTLVRGGDLNELTRDSVRDTDEVRVHFHVPLSRKRMGPLRTTREDTEALLRHALRHPDPPQLVIETYTWPIMTGPARPETLAAGIQREFRWVLDQVR